MKLLICTQTVDRADPNLGFFVRWIEEFAKHCEQVTVICLRKGDYSLPKHVSVYEIGKGNKLTRAIHFLKFAFELREQYDRVFVHMNPEYLVLAGWYWRFTGRKTALWYAHKSVTPKLLIATAFVNIVCSVTLESFPLRVKKLHALGHGIDTDVFKPQARTPSDKFRLMTAGRIAESKHLREMLLAVELLRHANMRPILSIAGEAGTSAERKYKRELVADIKRRGLQEDVQLLGAVEHRKLPAVLAGQDVFLNFGTTGNMDKAGFEPLAMGIPLVSTNPAFKRLLEPYGLYADATDMPAIMNAIVHAREVNTQPLMEYTRNNHSLSNLIPKILALLA